MRTPKTHKPGILSIIAIGFLFIAPAILAQDHIIGIGQVNGPNGALVKSANTVGGVVASIRNSEGAYTVTITAVGAFAGTVPANYVAEVTCEDSLSDDVMPKITISAVDANVLTLLVHTDDVEDDLMSNTNSPRPFDNSFFFSVYRIPGSFPVAGSTKYLLAAGKVSTAGTLLGGTGVDGVVVASSSNAPIGDYNVTLTKPGEFTGAIPDDFVILLSLNDTGVEDEAIRGDVTSVTSDVVTLNVHTDDIQDESDDNAQDPENNTFHFTIYRIPTGAGAGLANSKLLLALGSVADDGTLSAGGAFDGGAIGSIRNSDGRYTVTITSPGAFAGKIDGQFVLQVHLNQGGTADEVIEGDIALPDDNTLTLTVATNDGEEDDNVGDDDGEARDAPFYFLIYDAAPLFKPDLRIGTKGNLTQHVGDDIYNAGSAGQKVRVGLRSTQKKRYFLSLENDGNISDDIFLKAKRSGNKIKSKYFRLTGGRKNVTAAITSAGHIVDDVPPSKIIKFEVQAKYKNPSKRPKKTLRFLARSEFLATQLDANKATLKPK